MLFSSTQTAVQSGDHALHALPGPSMATNCAIVLERKVPSAQSLQMASLSRDGAASFPAAHFCTSLHLPALPGLSVKPTPRLHGKQGVAGFESWSVVPAGHLRSAHALAPPSLANVPLAHLLHLPLAGAEPASQLGRRKFKRRADCSPSRLGCLGCFGCLRHT